MDVRHTSRNGRGPDAEEVAPSGAEAVWTVAVRGATMGIFVLLLCVIVVEGRSLLMPIVAGIVIGMMFSPLVTLAARYHVPSWLSALLVTVGVLVIANVALTLLSVPLVDWLNRASEIGQLLSEKLRFLERTLAAIDDVRKDLTRGEAGLAVKVDTGLSSLVAPVLATLTPALGSLLIFFGTLYFFLLGREQLRRGLVLLFAGREMRLRVMRILSDIEQNLTRFLVIVAIINLAVGCLTVAVAYLAGLPSPVFWGVLAFVLNFIPYIGPFIVMISLLLGGIISFPLLGQALIAPAAFVAITTIEGHFLTPSILGRHLTLSPFAVFLALAFWTWAWGPIGAFLATPLLIVGAAALDHMMPANGPSLPG